MDCVLSVLISATTTKRLCAPSLVTGVVAVRKMHTSYESDRDRCRTEPFGANIVICRRCAVNRARLSGRDLWDILHTHKSEHNWSAALTRLYDITYLSLTYSVSGVNAAPCLSPAQFESDVYHKCPASRHIQIEHTIQANSRKRNIYQQRMPSVIRTQ